MLANHHQRQQQSSSSSLSTSPRNAVSFRPITKSVRFSERPDHVVDNLLLLSEEDCHDLWYSLHDLSVMRAEQERGRNDSLDKKNKINHPVEQQELRRISSSSSNGESNKRHYHRKLTVQCIRSACRKGMSEEKIAEISRRCSAGCVQLAALQAIHDYVAVHHPECPPEIFVDLPPLSSIQPTFPFSMRKRRRVVVEEQEAKQQRTNGGAGATRSAAPCHSETSSPSSSHHMGTGGC